MSHWICCNSCFLSPSNERRLAVTSCGHLVCNVCYQRGKPGECLICKTACQVSPLSSKSCAEVKALFTDVSVTMKKHVAEINKVLTFQTRHHKRLMAHYKMRNEKLEEVLMAMKQEMQLMNKKLNEQNSYISKLECSLQRQSAKMSSMSPMSFSSHTSRHSVHQLHQPSPQPLSRHPSTLSVAEIRNEDRVFRKPISSSRLSLVSSPLLGRMGAAPHRPASQNSLANATRSATVSRTPVTPEMCLDSFGRMSGWQSPIFNPSTPLRLSPVSPHFHPPL